MFGLIQSMDVLLIDIVQFLEFVELRLKLIDTIFQHLNVHTGSMLCSSFLFLVDDLFVFSGVMLLTVFLAVAPIAPFEHLWVDCELLGKECVLGKGLLWLVMVEEGNQG